jgi:eukaryotic-like serine/threonine-protein kinase
MPELDPLLLLEHATLLGLITREQAFEARSDAREGTLDAIVRTLLRKGSMTSWQVERLKKGERGGFVLGGYKVLFHLAEGTFARVYRGERIHGGQPVAVKVLRRRFVAEPGAIERFNKEAQGGMRLRHPNIVRVLDFGNEDKQYFMIMEYVEGSNLRDLLKIRAHIDEKAAVPMMIGLAKGLKYSFDNGVTHRDIKGTNILISTNGVAKLVDFGLATIEEDGKRAASINQRTVDYSALERTCGCPKGDLRSDIFFLGCVFYQMLTGQPPMPETETKDMLQKMLKRSFGAIKPLREHRYAPDGELTRIIEKMMKVDLAARYPRIEDVIEDLERFASRKAIGGLADVPQSSESDDDDAPIDFTKVQLFLPREPEEEVVPSTKKEADAAFEIKVAQPKQVLCVESQGEIQEAFRKSLSKMGYQVYLVGDAGRAAERCRETSPDAVIFDADGLGLEAVGAFLDMRGKARQAGHPLPALVLLGPHQLAIREQLPSDERVIVLAKPVKMRQVQEAIAQLILAG